MLGSDISSEGSAPGGALSGEMIDNPATSGDATLSSLFQSGTEAEAAPAEASADAAVPAAPYGADASASSPGAAPGGGSSRPMGKLAATGSLGGSSGGSMTAGSTHGQFFGSGNKKAEIAPVSMDDAKKSIPSSDRKGVVTAMLNTAVSQGKLAARTGNMDAAHGGAASAFTGGGKAATTSDLAAGDDEKSSVSGIELGQAAGNLKKNDPNLNKSKITMPKVTAAAEVKDPDQEFKQALIKMILGAALGAVFGSNGLGGAGGTK
jgi:hypothetical protein